MMSMAQRGASVPNVVRGSVIVHRRRSAKPTAGAPDGVDLYESTVLSYSEGAARSF
jgi:hypothetical protein